MLKQLKTEAITKATLGSGWLWSLCDNFNTKNKEDIQAGAKFQLELNLYMYAYNEPFVQALTHPNAAARTNIPAELLEAASIPAAPEFVCCFSQLAWFGSRHLCVAFLGPPVCAHSTGPLLLC